MFTDRLIRGHARRGGSILAVLACSTLAHAVVLAPAGVEVYRGPTNLPDTVGGFASDRVIVRLAPGVVPGVAADGSLVLATNGADPRDGELEAVALISLAAFGVESAEPALRHEPSRPDVAAALGLDRYWILRVPIGSDVGAVASGLSLVAGAVEVADVDGIGGVLDLFPNDPSFGVQYGLHNTGQTVQGSVGVPGADINAAAAWSLFVGSPDVVIAIIDTGVAGSHADLAPKMVPGYNAINGGTSTGDSILIPHGTHCAGIAAAATNNGAGIAGVDWQARIMPIKALNFFGGGTETDVANGIAWAADNGAHVASLSLGFPTGSAFFADSVAYAWALDTVIVAATGNTPGAAIAFPARFPQVIAVGATGNTGTIASFTTTGPQMELVAPGVDVYSTWVSLFNPTTYTYQSGTSMACPHVAGVAALVRGANPALTNQQVRQILRNTAVDLGVPGWDPIYGHGLVDAHAAVLEALGAGCGVGDIDCDGVVGGADLGLLLAAWGSDDPDADLDGDGVVDGVDLGILLENWSG